MTVDNKEVGVPQVETKVEANKTTEESPKMKLIDKRREEVENLAIEENATHASEIVEQLLTTEEPVKTETEKVEETVDTKEVAKDTDPIERMKSKVQKRIDKEVAKTKTLEEQLNETRRELEEIRNKQNATVVGNKNDNKSDEPTLEQISAYLKKVREEGNVDEEVRVLDYISERRAKAEKKAAMEEFEGRNKKSKEEEARQVNEWNALHNDYTVTDENGEIIQDDPMNLANHNGKLYKLSMKLFHNEDHLLPDYDKNGKPIPKLPHYKSDPNKVMGFRRAVTDAFREIYQSGLNSKEKLTVDDTPKPRRRQVLVESSSDGVEETVQTPSSKILSDQDKVIEEIRSRRSFQNKRIPIRQ